MNEQLRSDTRETIGGVRVADPFRALERDDAATQAWIAAQTERTERALEQVRDPKAQARLNALLSIGTLDDVALGGSRVFFSLREPPRERPALYVFEPGASIESVVQGPPLIDPEAYGERAALDYVFPSPDGRYVAFGVSDNGDERAQLRIFDVEARNVLPDTIAHAKWSAVDWLHDATGFFYRRYPRSGEPDWKADEPDSYYAKLWLHRLGQDPGQDALVFRGDQPVDFPLASVDETGRYVAITNERSWTASDVWLWDRQSSAGAPPTRAQLVPVVQGEDKTASATLHEGYLYLLTDIDAPKQRVVRVPLSQAGQRELWQVVVPETDAAIQDAVITRSYVVVHTLQDVHSALTLYRLDGERVGEIPLPGAGSISALAGTPSQDRIAFVWSSMLQAPSLYQCELDQGNPLRIYQVAHDFDASAYALSQVRVPSADGTPINVFYIHKRDLAHNGENPVLVYGYGGFDVSLLPGFVRNALYFLELGGIYAQANLRGGGEFGEDWHRAGMLDHKQRVFEDFEAVVRWFSSSGLSSPRRVGITGASNGGLLMGAMITRAPHTFAAAATYVGLYDMLRYPQFPPAALWTSEYGDPSDPAMARYLLTYSPYHNVRDGVRYPAVLIETADHDTRVYFGHSTKFAARLQTATAGPNPIYFYMERAVGHGHGTGLADLTRRYVRQYAFLREALGM